MEFTNDDDSKLEYKGNMDELLISDIQENENLRNKIISHKVEKEEAKRREEFLNNRLKENKEICENCEVEIVSLGKE